MRRITLFLSMACFAGACGGSEGSTEIVCGEGASGALTAGGRVEVTGGAAKDLAGAAVAAQAATTVPAEAVSIACADDIVPDGFVALGPAVAIAPAGADSARPFAVTLPYKAARLPAGAGRRHVRIVAVHHVGDGTPFFPPVSNIVHDDANRFASRVTFFAAELATYQVVASATAGQTAERTFSYRAIAGVSMGGGAATAIALRNPGRFDLIGDLGGEPGPDVVYTMDMISQFHFGGFCTAEDEAAGTGAIGELCPSRQRALWDDQMEIGADFEHLPYQSGDGVGLTLRRNLYIKASRDLSRALGNPALYNPEDPYRPPGVPASYLALSAEERCANALVLDSFFDREYNPDGSRPVITFCDGGDSQEMGLGVFDPSLPQTNPMEVMLAVDVNGNGVRDYGEPIVINAFEPFDDVGVDGVASADEPGYDAATNPDPNGDDWHFWKNPRGTEGNLRHEDAEPYEDVGLDGVAATCQLPEQGCYDHGEGDGAWTVNPNVERWWANDAKMNLEAMSAAERAGISIWADAGIRDFFNGHVAANAFIGALAELELPVAVFDGFGPLHGLPDDAGFDFNKIDWSQWPDNIYVRYGNIDASDALIEAGDGRHVGTPQQLIARITSMFAWINARWPGGDKAIADQTDDNFLDDQLFTSPTTGRETPYAVFVPPGYYENEQLRYPVVYFLHGYGQEPDDLIAVSAIFSNYMIDPDREEAQRFQKMIIVYVDGRCRPGGDGVPPPAVGDGCEQGTFYMDSPTSAVAKMETALFELMDEIDTRFRTKAAETVEIVP